MHIYINTPVAASHSVYCTTYDAHTATTAERCDTQPPPATGSKPALQNLLALPSGYRHPTDTPTVMANTTLS